MFSPDLRGGMNKFNIYTGDCLDVLKTLADNSIDSIVTDPPYGLSDHGEKEIVECMQAWMAGKPYVTSKKGFMGKTWDSFVPGPEVWREAFRVLKPGAYMIVFASTRTDDLMSLSCRLAGFRKHPTGMWIFGSGFPKATNLSKAFDAGSGRPEDIRRAAMGADYKPSGRGRVNYDHGAASVMNGGTVEHTPALPHAKAHEGWFYGLQSLKPAFEPWLMFQKPHEGRMTDNVLKYGTGAINIDSCRVATSEELRIGSGGLLSHVRDGKAYPNESTKRTGRAEMGYCGGNAEGEYKTGSDAGRWPANIVHDGSDAVVAMFPQGGGGFGKRGGRGCATAGDYGMGATMETVGYGDSGSAARFFTQCQQEDSEWLAQNLRLLDALIAEQGLPLQKVVDAIAQSDAVISALPEGTALSVTKVPSMIATASESRNLAECVITAIQSIGIRSLREWRQEELSQTNSRVSVVASREPTGTMTITASHWKSNGCADPVMFSIILRNLEHGGPGCLLKYCPKASKADREEGLSGFDSKALAYGNQAQAEVARGNNEHAGESGMNTVKMRANNHPTVKPTSLMRHLVRLITPPGGTCADLFMGSGSTGKAAMLEGFNFIGIEEDADYAEISRARIEHAAKVASGEVPKVASEKPCAARYPIDTEASEVVQGVLF